MLGYPSLFAYCVEAIGLSESAAGRRIVAARICRRFPEAFELVARGELHLCALCTLAPHVTEANVAELFGVCARKPRRKVEELLATRFARADVRARIQALSGPIEPLAADRYGVHFTADSQLREKIEEARSLARHRLPNGDLAGLMELAFDAFIGRERVATWIARAAR